MIDLINKVIFDFKRNFKPFIIIYIVFIIFFYLNDVWKSKVVYNYNSSFLFTEPSSISDWAQFDEVFFKQSLYLYVSNLDTNVLIKENCSIETIAKHNIDNEPNTPTKYGVRGIPTMLLFKGGELKATKVGATTKSNIVSWIKENI